MQSFWTETITRIRPGETTERGQTIPNWDDTDELEIDGCNVQPSVTSLNQEGRVLSISDAYTAYLPTGSDVRAGDHIVYNGMEFEIDGEPRRWSSPTGRLNHIQLSLVRWRG